MQLGEPVDSRVPFVRKVHALDEARSKRSSGARLEAVRAAGELLGDDLRTQGQVHCIRALPLTTLLYPTRFAFNGACLLPVPYLLLTHRALFVQVKTEDGIKNILFNPTDFDASLATPYFAKMLERVGETAKKLISKQWDHADMQLRSIGIAPEDIDIIAFDHFHTQDLRPLLGSDEPKPDGSYYTPRYPNAHLLAPRAAFEDWSHLHPLQRSWFVADGKRGVPESRVVLTDNDLSLGSGALLLRTPGHTRGNQTLFVSDNDGVFGCSENGCAADNWSPYESAIPGLRTQVRTFEADVILNANTPELSAEQYTSMMLEIAMVDRVKDHPAFVRMLPSSEVTQSLLAPGVVPALNFSLKPFGKVEAR